MKYTKDEILSILQVNYLQRIQIEKGLPSEDDITYDLTMREWIDNMGLLEWKELAPIYAKEFEIEVFEAEFRRAMQPIKQKTIGNLCEYLATKAQKPNIKPIKLFGNNCEEAGIFRYLKKKCLELDIKANEIKPSSKIQDFMNDFGYKIVTVVNRIDPSILPLISYEENEFEKQSYKLYLSTFAVLIIASFLDNWFIGGIGIGALVSLIWMDKIATKLPAKRFEFEGIETFRDLVKKIQLASEN